MYYLEGSCGHYSENVIRDFFLFKHIDNILIERKILNIIFKAPITKTKIKILNYDHILLRFAVCNICNTAGS